MKEVKLKDIPELRVLGRTNGKLDPLTVFWHASGIEVSVRASELWLEVSASYTVCEPWIVVLIDGEVLQRRPLAAGTERILLFRGLDPGRVRNVRVLRDTQPMQPDPEMVLQFSSFLLPEEGEFLPAAPYKRKIEFIGDSITTGEGSIGTGEDNEWSPIYFDVPLSYTKMTAELLDAEYRCFSQGGWGAYVSWDRNFDNAVPRYFDRLCAFLKDSPEYRALGAYEPWDFASWQPDYVVINLGTNDCSGIYGYLNMAADAKESGGAVDPRFSLVSAEELRESAESEHRIRAELSAFAAAGREFLKKLRAWYPAAHIIWCYGMLDQPQAETIKHILEEEVVGEYRRESGDGGAEYLELPATLPGEFGCRMHPGPASHRKAAALLSGHILKLESGDKEDRGGACR